MVSQLGHLRFLTPLGKKFDLNSFEFGIGNAMAIDEAVLNSKPDYYKFLETGSRDGLVALKERLILPYQNGMLVVKNKDDSLRFDDRAFRFDKIAENKVFLGPTHYGEFLASNNAAILDAEIYKKLVRLGLEDFSDEDAYLSNILMVTFSPITLEEDGSKGTIFSKRSDKVAIYPEFFCCFGGKVEFDQSFFDSPNRSKIAADLIIKNLYKESKEELGLAPVSYEFKGIVDGMSGQHFHFETQYNLSAEEIIASQKSAKDAYENANLIPLKNTNQVLEFMIENKDNLVAVGYGAGLNYLLSCGDFESFATAYFHAPGRYAVEL